LKLVESNGESFLKQLGAAGFSAALDSNITAGLLSEVTGQLSALMGRPTTPLKMGLRDAFYPNKVM
jgi:hypothetical protein